MSVNCRKCGSEVPLSGVTCPMCGESVASTYATQPQSVNYDTLCRVCGHPLKGQDMCEMCGTPAAPPSPRTGGLRCPMCNGELGDDLGCPRCGKLFGREIPEKQPEFQCPGCGKVVSMEDMACKGCGLRIWMDESTVSSRLDALRCPACASALGDADAKCATCGFEVWADSEIDKLERATEAIEHAALHIQLAQEKLGEEPDRAVTYLDGARRVLEEGEVDLAWRRALVAAEIAETTARQVMLLDEAVRRAEERMRSAEQGGGDVSECRQLLQLSRQASEKGDRKVALRLALKCKILAESIEESLRHAPIGP